MTTYISKLLTYGYVVKVTDYYGLVLVIDKWHDTEYTCFRDKLRNTVNLAKSPQDVFTAIQESAR